MTITLTLPLPNKDLNPNARIWFVKKAKLVKVERETAYCIALSWLNERKLDAPRWKTATVKCHYYSGTRHKLDGDNVGAMLKPIWDGLADAGIFENDRGVTHMPPELLYDREKPRLEIEIEGTP